MLFSRPELLVWKLLALHSSGLIILKLYELYQVPRTGIISLCRMMSYLRTATLDLSDL